MLRAARIPQILAAAILLVAANAPVAADALLQQQPPRDTSAQRQPSATGKIAGRVLTADTGKPVKRARVLASAAELPGARATVTDDSGSYELSDLPSGRYSITASKTGFITLSYGQRRPLQAGTPLQLADGQQLKGVDFRLPRGGAIAGRISDEDGEPMPAASVRVMRYEYQQGERRLVQAGTGQTDDKGQYRVWGLMPGDYYVSVSARAVGGPPGGGRFGGAGAQVFAGGGRLGGFFSGAAGQDDQESIAYAPTYYPGVGSVNEATAVTLGVSQEALDVSFSLQLVRTARLSGRATSADGTPATSGMVTLTAENAVAGSGRGQIGVNYGARVQWDGTFTIPNVPPGRYTLRARGGNDEVPQYGEQPVTVAGGEVAGLVVPLARGATISGTVTFQATQLPIPNDPTTIRITAPPADQGQFAANGGRVDSDGQFIMDAIPSGARFIRASGAPRGWSLKSVIVGSRDVIDTPIDVRPGETIKNVSLVFTDAQTQISGTVTAANGTPVTDYTVLAFSVDQAFWRPQSRHIMTARADQNGKYQIRGLPAGEYYLALIDPAEQGEWFEPAFLDAHRSAAARVSLGEIDAKTQDFKLQ